MQSGEKRIKKIERTETYTLDTSAMLALWNDEDGASEVEHILRFGGEIYISFMTLMEGRYRLWKNIDKNAADEFSKYLDLLPIKRIDVNSEILEKAVEIKATNNLSVCDSWIIATAMVRNSILVHKDPEFEQVKSKVRLKALPYKR
jgi:predicted nucleic acid-binding protein